MRWIFTVLAVWMGMAFCQGQSVVWQDQVGHPRRNADGTRTYLEYTTGMACFADRMVVGFTGFAYYTAGATSHFHNQFFLRYYDYDGRLLKEDTIGGMVTDGTVLRLTDSTFLVRVNYTYLTSTESPFDTGQMGGCLLRAYTSQGRLLWQRRMWTNTRSSSSRIFLRLGGGFSLFSRLNMDNLGGDSTYYPYFTEHGFFERMVAEPTSHPGEMGLLSSTMRPERYLMTRAQRLGFPGPYLYTVLHLDSLLRVRREDTIGVLPKRYGNETITPGADGSYIATLPDGGDTLRSRLYFFDAPGRFSRSQLVDSGGTRFISLADGGALAFGGKYVTNLRRVMDSLRSRGLPYRRNAYFQRLNPAFEPVWSVDIQDWVSELVSYSYTPAASIPSSPEDAIFYGSRIVSSRVQTEPWGTFALIGRINGVGRLFDPTAVRPGPRTRPEGLNVYPNPAERGGSVTLSGTGRRWAEVRDLTGRLRHVGWAEGGVPFRLPAGLEPGVYLVRCGSLSTRLVVR